MTQSKDDCATGCTVRESWFIFRQVYDINILSEISSPVLVTGQTAMYRVPVILPGVKLLGFSAGASCLHNAEIKNWWSYTSFSA
jgi:hypothetical protein